MNRTVAVVAGLAVSLIASAAAIAGATLSPAVTTPMTARAFTVRAEGFPIEPAPGTNQTSLGVRPLGTRVSLSNAPADAYGRATTSDLGTIELYTGPPPAGNTAECDATRPNLPRDAVAEPGGSLLEAHCTRRPSATVTARAPGPSDGPVQAATQSSKLVTDGGGASLLATSDIILGDVELGPLRIGTIRFRGRASATGVRGGASARGVVEAVDASVNGVPVVVGSDGVTVDETQVPLELVPSAGEALRAALAQGGYSDVRVVRPRVTAAADGKSAEVFGGGVRAYFSNNEPTRNYFLSVTLAGSKLAVFAGGPLDAAVPQGDGVISLAAPPPAIPAVAGASGAVARLAPPAGSGPATDVAVPSLEVVGRTVYEPPRPWRGWWLFIAVAAVLTGVALVLRRRVGPLWADFATRFLRG